MVKFHSLLEFIAIIFIFGIFLILFIYYYFPIKDKIVETQFGKAMDINSRVYGTVEKNLNFFGIYDFFSRENADHGDFYSDWNETQLIGEAKSLNITEVQGNECTSSAVVLNYHGTMGKKSRTNKSNNLYSISDLDFKEHMFALKKAGYQTISIAEFYAFLRGEKKLPRKSFLLTFDDGIKESYYNTDPILKALNYSAVMFVITGQSLEKNSPYYLNSRELQEMHDTGRWEIESHGYKGHLKIPINDSGALGPFFSNKLWLSDEGRIESNEEYRSRVYNDLKISKEQLEKAFNKSVIGFAIPFGEFGQRDTNYKGSDRVITNSTQDFYRLVFYQFKPAINKDFRANFNNEKKNFYLVMRISADSIGSSHALLEEVEAAQSVNLPYYEKFNNGKRWVNVWGRVNLTSEHIEIYNNPGGGGAMVYLDGSYLWKDYNFSVSIKEHDVQKIILASRFQDSYNYAGCKYVNNSVSVLKVVNQEKEELNGVRVNDDVRVRNYFSGRPSLSVSAKEDKISCIINDYIITSAFLNGSLQHGGIGVRLENPNLSQINTIRFSEIRAEPN